MKASKAQLQSQCNALTADNGVLLSALNHLVNGEFKLVGRKACYTVRLAAPRAPHGGIVLVTYAPTGQRPYTSAHYLDRWHDETVNIDYIVTSPEGAGIRDLAYDARRMAAKEQQETP